MLLQETIAWNIRVPPLRLKPEVTTRVESRVEEFRVARPISMQNQLFTKHQLLHFPVGTSRKISGSFGKDEELIYQPFTNIRKIPRYGFCNYAFMAFLNSDLRALDKNLT